MKFLSSRRWAEFQQHLASTERDRASLAARCTDLEQHRRSLEQRLGELAARLASAEQDRDGYRDAYLRYEGEIGQARADAAGYKAAYDEATTELSRFRCLLREAPPPPDRPRQFVFLHIQKTGGISLLDHFGRHFEWHRTLWVFSPAELDAYSPAEVAHFDRVCGHITARNLAAVRPGAFLCTFLREPVDRVLSCYWYFRSYSARMREGVRHAVESARSKSLLEFLRDPTPEVRRHLHNHQAHALVGDWAAPDDRPDDDLAAAAVAALDRFDVVGLTEELDAGLARICRCMGWPAPEHAPVLNRTEGRPRGQALSAAEEDAIRALTRADAAVYQAAKSRVAKAAGG